MRINERRSLWRRMKPLLHGLRRSAGDDPVPAAGHQPDHACTRPASNSRAASKARSATSCVAFVVMWVAALVPPQTLMRLAVPIYTVGVALLMAVFMFGIIKKGARRWLHIGVDIQPSEIMKIAMPLMLAWYFQQRAGVVRWNSFLVAAVLLAVPVGLIQLQPDLGTSLLVLASGMYVIFLAGLSWKALAGLVDRRRRQPAGGLVADARLPARPRDDADRPHRRPARQGLPHHPVDHRDRLGRRDRARAGCRAPRPTSNSSPSHHRLRVRGLLPRNSA